MDLIQNLRSPDWYVQPHHWDRLNGILGKTINRMDPEFCLGDLYNLELYKHAYDVADIYEGARKEEFIRRKLN